MTKSENIRWVMDCHGRIVDYDLRRGLLLRRHLVLGDYPSLYVEADSLTTGEEKPNRFCYLQQEEQRLPDFYILPQDRGTVAFKNAETGLFVSMNPTSWYPEWLVDQVNDWEKICLIDTQTFHGFGLLDEVAAAKIYDETGKEILIDLPNASFPFYRLLGECNFNFLDNMETIKSLGTLKPFETREFSLRNHEDKRFDFKIERTGFEIPDYDGTFNPYF